MPGIALQRLEEEWKALRRHHPYNVIARPLKDDAGVEDLLRWECAIPGPPKTPWENGLFWLSLQFTEDYPSVPPSCKFKEPLFHPNVFPSGTVDLNFLSQPQTHWKSSITIMEILLSVRQMLAEPDTTNVANAEACALYCQSRSEYDARVSQLASRVNINKYTSSAK